MKGSGPSRLAHRDKNGRPSREIFVEQEVFLELPFKPDSWRVSQVREIGNIDEQPILAANQWRRSSKRAIRPSRRGSMRI